MEREKKNTHLSGLSLKGTTLETQGSKIKVHLDIDKKQSLDTAYWFDYKTIAGNVMHSMPENGMSIVLQFNDAQGSAQVTHAMQTNSPNVSDRSDYNNRYLTTSYNKRMAMLPKALYFSSDSNLLRLDDARGITGNTNENIKISAGRNLLLKASGKVSLFTPEHIYLTKPGSKSVIDFAGNEINIKSPNTLVSSDPNTRQRPYPPTADGPPMQMGKGLAAMVLGTAPIVASTKRSK